MSHVQISGANMLAALVHLGGVGRYIHWGFVQISLANLVVIAVMIVMFLAAILVPFHGNKTRQK